ncbi:MAG: cadherin-like domain-containing protein [Nostoc sp. DedQUE01]|nr:cadherin-like domain-containing protein [Nostoc sp. DedQUE11]MDZ8075169.1 cadherin-like domain-containing protein [Nostoc sp. DedQUE01]
MGGAIFIRSGSLNLNNTSFTNNSATGGTGANNGQGLGDAIFAVTPDLAAAAGVTTAPQVNATGNFTFNGNTATNTNPNLYGTVSFTPANLFGRVYFDLNKNGILDPNEPGIPGVTLTLSGTNTVNGSVNLTTTTDATGSYSFSNLAPGTYTLTETQPTDYNDSQETVGSASGTVGNDVISNISLTAGANATGYNFGQLIPNQPPVAGDDTATTNQNTPLTLLATDLLANDTDVDSSTLSITNVSNAVNGTVAVNNGNVVFTPTTDFTGNAKFDYTVSDGNGGTDTATVNLTIKQANFTGTPNPDTIIGTAGNNIINGLGSNDTLTGNGGQDKFIFRAGDGNDIITDFGGVGIGSNPSAAVIAQVDTLQFQGAGLTAKNLQLTQNVSNLEVTFDNVANTKVTLQNFVLENLDNLPASGARPIIGNILFNGQTSLSDSFDVFDANWNNTSILQKNTVTFLNDLNNNTAGFDNSNDVINAQGGNDRIDGLSGNDLLRGGTGNDSLIGSAGNDTLVGGAGNDVLTGGTDADFFVYNTDAAFTSSAVGIDTIADFKKSQGDKIVLDKTTFAISSVAGNGFSNSSDFKSIGFDLFKLTILEGISSAKIVYDAVNGRLFYNENGTAPGFGSGGQFATLTGPPNLSASDFIIQA